MALRSSRKACSNNEHKRVYTKQEPPKQRSFHKEATVVICGDYISAADDLAECSGENIPRTSTAVHCAAAYSLSVGVSW